MPRAHRRDEHCDAEVRFPQRTSQAEIRWFEVTTVANGYDDDDYDHDDIDDYSHDDYDG